MSSNRVEIIISGPQGTGKAVFASVIASLLAATGVQDVIFFDEDQPTSFLDLPSLADVKKILSRQRVTITTTTRVIDLEEDSSLLSVDDALELLLIPAVFAQGTHHDHDSDAARQSDLASKTHHTVGKSNCQSNRPEDRHANNT